MNTKSELNITTVTGRSRLQPRDGPYWATLGAGRSIGFRRLAEKPGKWLARYRDGASGKYNWTQLGDFSDRPDAERFRLAKAAAEDWFAHLDRGGIAEVRSVAEACSAYAEHIRATKGAKQADELRARYRCFVEGDPIGGVALKGAKKEHFRAWVRRLADVPLVSRVGARKGAVLMGPGATEESRKVVGAYAGRKKPRSPATVARNVAVVRAALNHARLEGWVADDSAWLGPLRDLPKPKFVDGDGGEHGELEPTRTYLPTDVRLAILNNASEEFRPFLQVLNWIPIRPGALAKISVAGLDRRNKTLRVGLDKRHAPRRISLPDIIFGVLQEQACGKLPSVPLLGHVKDGGIVAWDKDSWATEINAAARRAGITEHVVLYQIRHSVLTDLIVGGTDILTVSKLSATSMEMLQRTYGHLTEKSSIEALQRMVIAVRE